jgi:hypothetical protein
MTTSVVGHAAPASSKTFNGFHTAVTAGSVSATTLHHTSSLAPSLADSATTWLPNDDMDTTSA